MNLLKNNRRGTASLADFYAAEFLFRENSKWHTILMNEVIDITKNIILEDIAFCICEELRYATTQTINNNEIKMSNTELLVDRWHEKNGHPQQFNIFGFKLDVSPGKVVVDGEEIKEGIDEFIKWAKNE